MYRPDLDSLRCLIAAAESPSFRSAARRVALSPAAFSDRIKRLEGQLGVELFHRGPHHLQITPAGRRMLAPAREAIEAAERSVGAARGAGGPTPFRLRLGTRFELGLSWLVPALDDLTAACPERTIDLYFGESDALMDRLRAGRVDALISSVRLTEPGLDYATLHVERYVFCGRPDRLSERPLVEPADARQHRLIDTQPDLPLFRYFRDARSPDEVWAFDGAEHMGTIAAVRARVLAGVGVAVLPRYFVGRALDEGRLAAIYPDFEPLTDRFRLVWRAGAPLTEALRALAESLRERPLQ